MDKNSSETVNFNDIKKLLNDRFNQQKDELINAVVTDLGNVNIEHKADVDRQIEQFSENIKQQINGINKKVVGWSWVVIIAIITFIASVLVSFIIITKYHEKYLSDRLVKQQQEWQTHPNGTTRAIPMPKTDREIQAEQDEILKSLKK